MGNKSSSASKDRFAANRREKVEDILANDPRRSKRRKHAAEMTEEERQAYDLELATDSHVFSGEADQEEEEEAAAAGADSHRANHRLDGLGGDGPKGADKEYAEALALRKRGDTKSCFQLLEKIIKENPKHVDSMAVYARLQWVHDDWDGAEETYLKALEIKSSHLAALEGYATFLASARGDIALAEKLFDRLQDLDTTSSTAIVRHMQAEQRLMGHKRGFDHHPESKAALAKERRSSITEAENERARRDSQPVPGLHLNHKDKGIGNLDEWRWPKGGEGALDEQERREKARGGRGRRGSEQAAVEYVLKTSDAPEIHQERERRFKGFPGSHQAEEASSPVVRSATMRGGGVARRHSALKWMMEGGLDKEYEAQRVQAHDPRELNTLRGLSGVMPATALPGRFERLIVQSFQDDWTLESKAPETGQVWPKDWYTSNSISQAGVAGLTQKEMRRASDFAAGSAPVSGMSGLKLVDNFIPMTVEDHRKLRTAKKIQDERQAVLDKDMGFSSALIAHAQEAESSAQARGGTFDSTSMRKSGSFVRARSFRRG